MFPKIGFLALAIVLTLSSRAEALTPNEVNTNYYEVLHRYPTSWELTVWTTYFSGTNYEMRYDLASGSEGVLLIKQIYLDTLNRMGADGEVHAWESYLAAGWTISQMRSAFVQDAQAVAAITRVYSDVLNRIPNTWEINVWQSNIGGWSWSIKTMRQAFTNSQECTDKINGAYTAANQTPTSDQVNAARAGLAKCDSLDRLSARLAPQTPQPIACTGGPCMLNGIVSYHGASICNESDTSDEPAGTFRYVNIIDLTGSRWTDTMKWSTKDQVRSHFRDIRRRLHARTVRLLIYPEEEDWHDAGINYPNPTTDQIRFSCPSSGSILSA